MQPYKIRKLGMRLTERDKIERFSARIMIHIMKRLTELEEITFELPKDRFEDNKAILDGKLRSFVENMQDHNVPATRAPPRLIYITQEAAAPPENI